MGSMRKQYGFKKGKEVFYASKNKGKISGVDEMTNIEEGLFQRLGKAISKRRMNFVNPSSEHAERVGITKKNIRDRSDQGYKESYDLDKEAEKSKERDVYDGVRAGAYYPEQQKKIQRNKQERDQDVADLKRKSERAEEKARKDAGLARSIDPEEAGETRKKRLKFRNKLRGSVFRRVAGAIRGPSSKGLKINASAEYKHIGYILAEALNLTEGETKKPKDTKPKIKSKGNPKKGRYAAWFNDPYKRWWGPGPDPRSGYNTEDKLKEKD